MSLNTAFNVSLENTRLRNKPEVKDNDLYLCYLFSELRYTSMNKFLYPFLRTREKDCQGGIIKSKYRSAPRYKLQSS